MLNLSAALMADASITPLMETVVQHARELLDADRATLYVVDWTSRELWSRVAEGTGKITLPLGTGIAGRVAERGECVRVDDVSVDSHWSSAHDASSGYDDPL